MSSLGETVESIGKEGYSKWKAKLLEKDLDKVEESLEKVAELYDGAVEAMPLKEQREARRACNLSYDSLDKWIRGARAKVWMHTKEAHPGVKGPAGAISRDCPCPPSPGRPRIGRNSRGTSWS